MTVECAIPQKFHRSVMGPKGSRIQQITRDYGVQIKFPDREENAGGSAARSGPPWGEAGAGGRGVLAKRLPAGGPRLVSLPVSR